MRHLPQVTRVRVAAEGSQVEDHPVEAVEVAAATAEAVEAEAAGVIAKDWAHKGSPISTASILV